MNSFAYPTSAPSQPQAGGQTVIHDRRITVDGVQTQYLEAGAGPVLLLLHGHEQSATSWRWVVPALARTRRVLALSLPGYGESGPAVGGCAPGADLAPFVAAFCSAIGAQAPLDLVGHSAGGAIALRLALADPARIRTLTLVDSAGLGREVHPLLALDTLPVIGELAVLISRLPGGDLTRTTMPRPCCSPSHGGSRRSSSPSSTSWPASRASSRPPPRWPAPCSGRTDNARS